MRTTICVVMLMLSASTAARTQQAPIPIRQVGPAEGVARDTTRATATIRPLSDGRVIVANARRVVAYDSLLSSFSVMLDTNALGPRPSTVPGILGARGDTTLVADVNAASFLVLDMIGKVVRVIAAPKARDINMISGPLGVRAAYVDPRGRLVYRASYPTVVPPRRPDGSYISTPVDSYPIVRADFDARAVDTLIAIRQGASSRSGSSLGADGRMQTMISYLHPFPIIDAWTMLPDGTIAIVRAVDYHVDWRAPDGTVSSSPKMPFDWRRITDSEKGRIVDSLGREYARMDSIQLARSGPIEAGLLMVTKVVSASELPDYYPPVRDGRVRSDPEGNLWILPTTSASAQGGLLYDVVNRKGEIFERVQLPPQCALNGIGPRGVLYLVCGNVRLEKRRVVRSNQ